MTETMMIIIVAGVVIMAFGVLCLISIFRAQKETQRFTKRMGAVEKDLSDITDLVSKSASDSQRADESILQQLKKQSEMQEEQKRLQQRQQTEAAPVQKPEPAKPPKAEPVKAAPAEEDILPDIESTRELTDIEELEAALEELEAKNRKPAASQPVQQAAPKQKPAPQPQPKPAAVQPAPQPVQQQTPKTEPAPQPQPKPAAVQPAPQPVPQPEPLQKPQPASPPKAIPTLDELSAEDDFNYDEIDINDLIGDLEDVLPELGASPAAKPEIKPEPKLEPKPEIIRPQIQHIDYDIGQSGKKYTASELETLIRE